MSVRIEDYAFIGNRTTSALVSRDGSIDWLCLPRFDSSACFAALLGDVEHGRWLICPQAGARSVTRRYRGDTLILETDFESDEGAVTVVDFLPFPRQDGTVDLVRLIRGRRGAVPMAMELALRFEYGRTRGRSGCRDGNVWGSAGSNTVGVRTPFDVEMQDGNATAHFTVNAGDDFACTLTSSNAFGPAPGLRDVDQALAETHDWWRDWSARATIEHEWREPVMRSLVTLKALTDHDTGGIVAAPTTSLPEQLGESANWDYRFCWLRDATFTLYALLGSGYTEEAYAWRDWLLRAVSGEVAAIQPLYRRDATRYVDEHELHWLPGYEGSRPVRIGNDAYKQRQIDIYGEIAECFYLSRLYGLEREDDVAELQKNLLHYLEDHWTDAGSGLWEMRGSDRAFTLGRVMTWVAFDRGIKMAERFGEDDSVERWREVRRTIHDTVCEEHFDAGQNTFVEYLGTDALDASLLLMPLVGFLPPDDPRIVSTVEAIQKDLMYDGLVYRHRTQRIPGQPPAKEGAFLLCSFWLSDCLNLMGRRREARALFERVLSVANDVGLLSEQYDPINHRLIGNFPQALSHIGLINTAHNLSSKEGPAHRRARR